MGLRLLGVSQSTTESVGQTDAVFWLILLKDMRGLGRYNPGNTCENINFVCID
jgi:hypothetical protein